MAVSSFLKWYLFVGLLLSLVALDLVNAEVENEGEAVSHESTSEEESDESVESTAEDETEGTLQLYSLLFSTVVPVFLLQRCLARLTLTAWLWLWLY